MAESRLKDLIVNRVDLVDDGDNPEAHIVLFKRKDEPEPTRREAPRKEGIMPDAPKPPATLEEALTVLKTASDRIDALETAAEAAKTEHETALKDRDDKIADLEKAKEPDPEQKPEDVLKSLDPAVREFVQKAMDDAKAAQEQATAAQVEVEKAREEREGREFVEKAKAFAHLPGAPADLAKALHEVHKAKPELVEPLETILRAADEQLRTAKLFGELGKGRHDDETSAAGRLSTLAKQIAKEKNVSEAEGYDLAMQTAEGARLYEESEAEHKQEVR